MIYQHVTQDDFINAFKKAGRDYYSYEGYKALYEYLTDLSEDLGQPYELDVIAICCDFTEYLSLECVQSVYCDIGSVDHLKEHTTVLALPNNEGFVIAAY